MEVVHSALLPFLIVKEQEEIVIYHTFSHDCSKLMSINYEILQQYN